MTTAESIFIEVLRGKFPSMSVLDQLDDDEFSGTRMVNVAFTFNEIRRLQQARRLVAEAEG